MSKRYSIEVSDKNCITMTNQRNTMVLYKLPYKLLKDKSYDIEIANNFIVYILLGHSDRGKDYIYVGKSKNGLFNRPIVHEGKCKNWEDCYVLTDVKEHTFFNDGVILFLEDKIRRRIDSVDRYINISDLITLGTVNANEEVVCLEYLEDVYVMLYTLGVDLLNKNKLSKKSICSQPSIIISKKDVS